jgi:hypothetical protein
MYDGGLAFMASLALIGLDLNGAAVIFIRVMGGSSFFFLFCSGCQRSW